MGNSDAPIKLRPGDALIVIDVQNDFAQHDGTLYVADGEGLIPVLNDYLRRFVSAGMPVFASRDWHPPNHCSFTDQGGDWPAHCVAGTPGAEFAPDLQLPQGAHIVSKAEKADEDAYSAFSGTDLAVRLRTLGIKRILIGGLATDYCVLNTVLDGVQEGFEVLLLTDAIRAVDVSAGDGDRAIRRMLEAGAVAMDWSMLERDGDP